MPQPAAPLPTQLGSTFTSADALQAGVKPGRLRAKDLETPFRGVRTRKKSQIVTPAPIGGEGVESEEPLARDRALRNRVLIKAREYNTIMAPHAFFAGRTAAVLYGAPIEHGVDLDVAVFGPARAPRRVGVRGRKVSRSLASTREHLGLRLTSPASTWAMLGAELDIRQLAQVGDALVRIPRDDRGVPQPTGQLATVRQLRAAASPRIRPFARNLRAAVELIRVGSASPLETDFRLDSAAAGLPEPGLDVEIIAASGYRIGITEIVYTEWRVLVEVEGDHHRTSRTQWNRDIDRYASYSAEGWEVVRLTSAHIRGKSPRAVKIVRDALVRRGWRPTAR